MARKKKIDEYMSVLNQFFRDMKIWDDEIRSALNYKFMQAYDNYEGFNDIGVEEYLRICLGRAYKQYWADKIRKAKKQRKLLLFSESDMSEKELVRMVDKCFTVNTKPDDEKGYYEEDPGRLYYSCLTWKQQQLVYYKFYRDMNFTEIAQIMRTTKQNIRSMYERLKKKFHTEFLMDFATDETAKIINVESGKVRKMG